MVDSVLCSFSFPSTASDSDVCVYIHTHPCVDSHAFLSVAPCALQQDLSVRSACSSWHLLAPDSQSSFLSPSPQCTHKLFSMSVSLCFQAEFVCVMFWAYMLVTSPWDCSFLFFTASLGDPLQVHPCCCRGVLSLCLCIEQYSIVYIHHIFFTHPSVHGHLGGLHMKWLLWISKYS